MAPINRDEVREVLREALDRAPYGTASRLAEATGVRAQTVSKWKAGEVLPEQQHWRTIERVLGMAPKKLDAAAAQPVASRSGDALAVVLDRLARVEARLARIEERSTIASDQIRDIDDQLEDLHLSLYVLSDVAEDFAPPNYDRVARPRQPIGAQTLDFRMAADSGLVGELTTDDPRGESVRPQPPAVDPDESA